MRSCSRGQRVVCWIGSRKHGNLEMVHSDKECRSIVLRSTQYMQTKRHAMLTAVLIDCAYKHRKHMQPSDDVSESELEREDRSALHSGKEWCERRVREVSEGGWSVWMVGPTPRRARGSLIVSCPLISTRTRGLNSGMREMQ